MATGVRCYIIPVITLRVHLDDKMLTGHTTIISIENGVIRDIYTVTATDPADFYPNAQTDCSTNFATRRESLHPGGHTKAKRNDRRSKSGCLWMKLLPH